MNLIKRLIQEEEGQTYVEYGVLIALIAIVVAVSAGWIGTAIQTFFGNISNSISGANVPAL